MEKNELIKILNKYKIGVLCGGISSEREISLRSGNNIYKALKDLNLNVILIDVDLNIYKKLQEEKIDIAIIALHGEFGEDGKIQSILDVMNIPYTGSGVLGSAIGLNKLVTKAILRMWNIPTPPFIALDNKNKEEILKEIHNNLGFPVIFKPVQEGSSVGVKVLHDEKEFLENIDSLMNKHKNCFIEKYIIGKELTIGLMEKKGNILVFPILELRPKNEFYDFEAKYTKGKTDFIIPAEISEKDSNTVKDYARKAFKYLYLNGIVRMDLILDNNGIPYFLEVNTIPGMTDTSDIPLMAKHAGLSFDELVLLSLENILDKINK